MSSTSRGVSPHFSASKVAGFSTVVFVSRASEITVSITTFPDRATLIPSRIASGLLSFNKYPEAPFCTASTIYSVSWKVVTISTFTSGKASLISLVPSIPLLSGMRISIKTTSGWCSLQASKAARPLSAKARTSTLPLASSMIFKPVRINISSSAIISLIGFVMVLLVSIVFLYSVGSFARSRQDWTPPVSQTRLLLSGVLGVI